KRAALFEQVNDPVQAGIADVWQPGLAEFADDLDGQHGGTSQDPRRRRRHAPGAPCPEQPIQPRHSSRKTDPNGPWTEVWGSRPGMADGPPRASTIYAAR